MQPFFFGPENSLFGAYHPPTYEQALPETAVLVCNGLGIDLVRSHRALWQLAESAAQRNVHTLRFDYYASGDSQGRQAEIDWQRALDDVARAAEELRQRSGLEQIKVLGLRLGAAAAMHAVLERALMGEIDQLILWDPWAQGQLAYRNWVQMHVQRTRNRNRYRRTEFQYAESDQYDVLGCHLSAPFIRELEQINLADHLRSVQPPVALLQSEAILGFDQLVMAMTPAKDVLIDLPEPGGWQEVHAVHQRLMLRRSAETLLNVVTAV